MIRIKDSIFALLSLLRYLIKVRNSHGHGIHSPAAFEFVTKVLYDTSDHSEYVFFNKNRDALRTSAEELIIDDMGAPSKVFKSNLRAVPDLDKYASISAKYGKLLFRIVKYYNLQNRIEFGTSLGVSAMYLAKGNAEGNVKSFEGNESLSEFSSKWHKEHDLQNIIVVNKLFSEAMSKIESGNEKIDLVFIDGDHKYESTKEYFNFFLMRMKEGFIILDDINWSAGMRKVWNEIVEHNTSFVTFDLYKLGIVMMRESVTPGTYTLRF